MKKHFITNLALLILLNLLIKPFWFFGIEVGVQNRVGEEMYGFYFSLFNFAFILNILLDLGINNFNNNWKIRRKPEDFSGMDPAVGAKTLQPSKHGGSGQSKFPRLTDYPLV